MSFFLATAVYFIACHGGPADHFATFAEELTNKGHAVQVYATGPALKKLQDRRIEAIPFSLEGVDEQLTAAEIAKNCSEANVVVTDVGHAFDIALQKALVINAPNALRWAYYDNPEAYVPGGYSSVAALVMCEAGGVLFANANLVQTSMGQLPEKRIGLGYYPLGQAEKIAKRRAVEHARMRARFLTNIDLEDRGQKVLVYAGGNNEEYFSKAFPAFLQFLGEASQQTDFSNVVVVLQQHPGAKDKNIDADLVRQWCKQHATGTPRLVVSECNSDDAQVMADGMLYYQTSMGPQFVLAGIPTMQVGHQTYEDILVKNRLCATATNVHEFIEALRGLQGSVVFDPAVIHRGLGIHADWADRLESALKMRKKR